MGPPVRSRRGIAASGVSSDIDHDADHRLADRQHRRPLRPVVFHRHARVSVHSPRLDRSLLQGIQRGIDPDLRLPDFKESDFVAYLFGGETFKWLFSLLYEIGWNINRRGEQWVTGFDARVAWWMILAACSYVVLSRTQLGNWIYATGDNKESARANGVPVNQVKIGLFMFTAFCATLFAACQVFDTNTADAAKGNLKELEAIAAAVVGGTVMTGGFGSIVGVIFGAVIFGLVPELGFLHFVD